jgi:cyanophycinase
MPGIVVLQGGQPFVGNDELDRRVLSDRRVERVVVLPTADAYEKPQDLVEAARSWGARIGVDIDPLMVLTRDQADAEAASVLDGASAVWLVGDSASHLRSVIKGTVLWDALLGVLDRDGVVVGCGASAAALCDPMTDSRGGGFGQGLGLISGLAIVFEAEKWSGATLERTKELATSALAVLESGSALTRTDAGWELIGAASVQGSLPPP